MIARRMELQVPAELEQRLAGGRFGRRFFATAFLGAVWSPEGRKAKKEKNSFKRGSFVFSATERPQRSIALGVVLPVSALARGKGGLEARCPSRCRKRLRISAPVDAEVAWRSQNCLTWIAWSAN